MDTKTKSLTCCPDAVSQATLRAEKKNAVEEYLPLKQLPDAIYSRHGLTLSTDNVRAIQQEAARLNDGLFLAGCARVSEVITWLKKHPEFSRPRKPKYGRAALIAA